MGLKTVPEKAPLVNGEVGDKGLLEKRYVWTADMWHKCLSSGSHWT